MSDALEELRTLITDSKREPEKQYELCLKLLKSVSLGDDKWAVKEQLAQAALDLDDITTAKTQAADLEHRFPKSLRVLKLKGLILEAEGKYKEAITLYNQISKENENDQSGVKRKIAILVAQGKTDEAIQELSNYLETYQSDKDAWQELALLNAGVGDYGASTFCFEDLVLSDPGNPSFHLACAESMYTESTPRLLIDARKHYAQSLVLRSVPNGNLRAAFGLVLNTIAIRQNAEKVAKALQDDEDPEEFESLNTKLNEWSCNEVLKECGSMVPEIAELVKNVMKSLQKKSKT